MRTAVTLILDQLNSVRLAQTHWRGHVRGPHIPTEREKVVRFHPVPLALDEPRVPLPGSSRATSIGHPVTRPHSSSVSPMWTDVAIANYGAR